MVNLCCDCEHLDRNDVYSDWFSDKKTYKCKVRGEYVKLDKTACPSFKEMRKSGSYTPSGCFITTIVCNILGYDDKCEVLELMRYFREHFLKSKIEHHIILREYDVVGPVIADKIINNPESQKLSLEMLNNFLIPCTLEVKKENFEQALVIYKNMVAYLNELFELPPTKIDPNETYNLETLGKARRRVNEKL